MKDKTLVQIWAMKFDSKQVRHWLLSGSESNFKTYLIQSRTANDCFISGTRRRNTRKQQILNRRHVDEHKRKVLKKKSKEIGNEQRGIWRDNEAKLFTFLLSPYFKSILFPESWVSASAWKFTSCSTAAIKECRSIFAIVIKEENFFSNNTRNITI